MNNDKKKIKNLEKENEELKKELEELKKEKEYNSNSSAWEFHWNGIGNYEEARRCFYGDFS